MEQDELRHGLMRQKEEFTGVKLSTIPMSASASLATSTGARGMNIKRHMMRNGGPICLLACSCGGPPLSTVIIWAVKS
ncbi:hypothetical protein M8494_22090 [Serratia ureilytica]